MCGIIGIVYSDKRSCVNQAIVDGLTILQHRGQDAAGIVTGSENRLHMLKNKGTVAEVFVQDNIVTLKGNIGIGHVRYPTAGGGKCSEAQPLYTNYPFGIAIAHNGNLTNTEELAEQMRSKYRHINTDSDSEVLLNVFADELQSRQLAKITPDDIFDAVQVIMRKCKGGYAVVMLINGLGLLAFRDPNGTDYAVASESVAIDALDHHTHFHLDRDVRPGEAILCTADGALFTRECGATACFTPCIFEYVYFARPDAILDGVQVYEARGRMGEKLAHHILSQFPAGAATADCGGNVVLGVDLLDIDVVIPIPETSRTAALQCASILNRPYREGFVKNRYIARTFIMPGQEVRRKTVRLKLNSIASEFRGKNVLLIDDSIVRGTTGKEIVQMARDAGAKKVYFASAAPPVRFCNVYGIDIPTRCELVAHERTVEEVAQCLGADRLEDIEEAIRSLNPTVLRCFDASCFDGRYVTPEVTAQYLVELQSRRGAGRTGAAASHNGTADDGTSDGAQGASMGLVRSPSCGNLSRERREAEDSVCETLFNEA